MMKYEVKYWSEPLARTISKEMDDKDKAHYEAKVLSIDHGHATVIHWVVYPNQPERWPNFVHQSSVMTVYENGVRRDCNIHGGW